MQGVDIHVQATGGVIATARLHDGRVIRVCGEKEYRGCKVSEEMHKWMKWEATKYEPVL